MSIRSAAIVVAALLIAGVSIRGETPDDTAVGHLNEMLRTGRAQLRFDGRSGYLRSVLDHLNMPLQSQVVTFSQASLHGPLVTDADPRAIFFSDDVAVAWAPQSSTVELAAYSPHRGLVFYTLDQSTSQGSARFQERSDCLACHTSARTIGVPGLLVLSTSRTRDSELISTDHRTPFEDRWGAWYVTGFSRRWRHQGNRIGQGWLQSLYDQFDTTGYPTLYSDIVALMVLEHQARASNLMSRAQLLSHTDPTGDAAVAAAEELADYMLFAGEAAIPAAIVGTSGFTEWFSSRTPCDQTGRSLYQLDLKRRLFRYPVSYTIYSSPFDALPHHMKQLVYARLASRLKDPEGRFPNAVLAADKAAALEILVSTKPDFRDFVQHRTK